MQKTVELQQGSNFGGMSLSKDTKTACRGATIFASEACHFAVLDKNLYLVKKNFVNKNLKELIWKIRSSGIGKATEFLKKFAMFADAPLTFFQLLSGYAQPLTLFNRDIVVDYGQKVKGFFLVKSGEIRVKFKTLSLLR